MLWVNKFLTGANILTIVMRVLFECYKTMFAVIELGGHQYKVEKGETFSVMRMEGENNAEIKVSEVLMVSKDGTDATVGAPYVSGAVVTLKVLEQHKGDKIRVFKMKPKKRYQKTYGHRDYLTKVQVMEIAA